VRACVKAREGGKEAGADDVSLQIIEPGKKDLETKPREEGGPGIITRE